MSEVIVPLKDEAEVLRIMDEELLTSPEHWTKGHDYIVTDGGGTAYCLRGARKQAVQRQSRREGGLLVDDDGYSLDRAVRNRINECIKEQVDIPPFVAIPFVAMTEFNDRRSTTFEDIKAVLKCAREKVGDVR